MAKYSIKFFDIEETTTIQCKLSSYYKDNDSIEIFIEDERFVDNVKFIYLDKSTAIKLAKTLRTEINKIKEEVTNG